MTRAAALALAVALLAAAPADAQYFGRNKVQYEDFAFRILATPHFDIYYYPEEREAARRAGQLAERWYARLSRALDHELGVRPPLVFYASTAHFAQTTVVPGFIGEGIGGITEHEKGRVVMPFAAGLGETDHILGHELVHVFQRDILRALNRSMATLPLWYIEGMAEYLSVGRLDSNTAMWLRDAAMDDRLPALEDLDGTEWFPYRYGQALWTYLAGRFGEDVVARSLRSRNRDAVGRVTSATGVDAAALSADWHKAIRAVAAEGPAAGGRAEATHVVAGPRTGARLTLGPALSPDGRRVVYLSERGEYSVDVYLADADTGVIERRLIQTAGDSHFDTLQYIGSSGAWDPSGTRFVLAAVRHGKPVLSILGVEDGDITAEIALPDLDEVSSPSWSPDGRRLVVSGLAGGFSDLYLVDLETAEVRALTDDPFADLHPAWSPDGRTIAFSTDRFTSSLDTLSFGAHRLGTIDVESGDIFELPGVGQAKHIDPQWAPDGASVYFVSDAGGRSNVYRVDRATGRVFQVTDVASGVSGITGLSPALSVARETGRLAYTVYRHGAYELRVGEPEGGTLVARDATGAAAAAPRFTGAVRTPAFGLVDEQTFSVKRYERGLSLDHVGQPYVSAGGGAFGGFIRAGIQFSFGDMLGEQSLFTAIQAGKSLDDFAAQALYVNRQSRWNWAVSGQQIPLLVGVSRVSAGVDPAAGGTRTTTRVRYRQIHRQFSGTAIYPFSQAERVEFSAGLHAIAFDREALTSVRAESGETLAETREATHPYPGITVVETAAALVHDSAIEGPTSPVLGTRYRLEIAPTLGTLTLATATADYRRYWMPARPFTVAARLAHLGRYGADSADPRLLPLAYDVRGLVRGFSNRTVSARFCGDDPDCAALEYLAARRLLVASLELRFPLLGALRGRAAYGPLPLEGVVFADNAWLPLGLHSAGAGVRVNAAGLVFELAGARRLGGLADGWAFAVNYRRGF